MENPQCNVVDTGTLVNIRKINAIILDLCRLPVSPCTSGYAADLGRVRGGGGLGRRMAACSSKGQWRAFLRDLLVERGLSLTNREAWTGLNTEFGVDVASSDRQWVRDALKELVEELGLHSGEAAKKSKNAPKKRATPVLLSSESDDDDLVKGPAQVEAFIEKCRRDQTK